jgi:transcription elongation factor GreB
MHSGPKRAPPENETDGDDEGPVPVGKLYVTRTGAEKLRAELKHLLGTERPRVTVEVSVAAAHGDRSENAEYIYGKKRLREIDRRIHFLQKRLKHSTVVDPKEQTDTGGVYFGATVTLENEEDAVKSTYQIVGPDETDTKGGRISVESPVGRSLLGRRLGDTVTVRRPKGEVELTVVKITYA